MRMMERETAEERVGSVDNEDAKKVSRPLKDELGKGKKRVLTEETLPRVNSNPTKRVNRSNLNAIQSSLSTTSQSGEQRSQHTHANVEGSRKSTRLLQRKRTLVEKRLEFETGEKRGRRVEQEIEKNNKQVKVSDQDVNKDYHDNEDNNHHERDNKESTTPPQDVEVEPTLRLARMSEVSTTSPLKETKERDGDDSRPKVENIEDYRKEKDRKAARASLLLQAFDEDEGDEEK